MPGSDFGQVPFSLNIPPTLGRMVGVIADGTPRYKLGGVTIDWTTVATLTADYVIPTEGRTVKMGQQYLRYGTVIAAITTLNNTPVTFACTVTSGLTAANVFTGVISTGLSIPANSWIQIDTGINVENLQVASYVSGTGVVVFVTSTIFAHANGVVVKQFPAAGNTGMYGPYTPAITGCTVTSGLTVAGVLSGVITAGISIFPGDWLTLDAAAQAENIQVVTYNYVTGAVVFATATTKTHANATAVAKLADGRSALSRGQTYVLNHTIVAGQDLASMHPNGVFDDTGSGHAYLARIASDWGGPPSNPTRTVMETAACFTGLDWVLD